ncbi:hypothetical protein NBE98_02645 [Clostridium swellfunianum]|uniref:hypothetical protein n=1 Tax=Clostridium swellfunianum TaxID=1367462 RepID=UPI00202E1A12|nr:hypothetical protein [Clostridium swellfunianum]MCM0647272.1 hypothetical protein [Clostridium swellfunianum]
MKRGLSGLVGGFSGGVIKIIIDQLLFTSGISPVNTVGSYSRLFLGAEGSSTILGWIIYIIATSFSGWIISLILYNKSIFNYFTSGIIVGVSFWIIMNVIFSISGTVIPTWSLGGPSIISDLITHSFLGVIITYFISRSRIEARD